MPLTDGELVKRLRNWPFSGSAHNRVHERDVLMRNAADRIEALSKRVGELEGLIQQFLDIPKAHSPISELNEFEIAVRQTLQHVEDLKEKNDG